MTNRLHPLSVRRWTGRGVVLASATVVLSLSASPGAHAGDSGPLGDVIEGVGGATQPVVQPVVEAVQSAVPQPVQQAVEPVVEPVVEDVVEPATSHVVQAVTSAPGAGKAAEPAAEVVEPVVHRTDDRAGGADGGAGGRADEPAGQPVEQPAGQSAGQSAAGTVDPVDGSAQAPAASQASASNGQTGSNAGGGSGAGGATGPATTSPPRDEQQPSRAGLCDDLPPRPMAVSAVGQLPDVRDPDQDLWNLTNALMRSWIDGDVPGSVDVGPPTDEDGDVWALGSLRGEDTDLQAPGRWGTVEVLELLGLFGLLGLLAAGLAVVVARQTE